MMRSRYEVYLNGVALSSIHPGLIVLDIQYPPTSINSTTATLAQRDGSSLLMQRRAGARVNIPFELHIYNTVERQKACEQVAAWAMAGGVLTTSDRPGQQLRVKCLNPPSITSASKWTQSLTVSFTAYERPYWEETTLATLSLTGTSNSGTLFVPGNAGQTVLEVTVTPKSTMANITLAAETSMTLTGVAAAKASPLVIDYDERMIQRIRRGTVSVLDKRTGADDLLITCGKYNAISYSASANVDVVFRARGVWL